MPTTKSPWEDPRVFIEMDGDHITVEFPINRLTEHWVQAMSIVPGRKIRKKPHRHWIAPLDITVCRQLRKAFGDDLDIGPKLRAWAHRAVNQEQVLGKIALSDVEAIEHLKARLPRLWRALYLGPLYRNATQELKYSDKEINRWVELCALMTNTVAWDPAFGSYQTADVRFLADAVAPLNGNQQGLGKTPEHVAAIWEAGMEEGCHLVIAPSAAVDGTWDPELELWHTGTPIDVEIYACTGTKRQRQRTLSAFMRSDAPCKWVVVNPGMVQYRKTSEKTYEARKAKPKDSKRACKCSRLKAPHWHYKAAYPELFTTAWHSICIDECHKGNIRNHRNLMSFSASDLQLAHSGKRFAMSGTPMKKKGADIWGVLHWLRPDIFTNFWQFAEQFFDVTSNGFGKRIGGLREEMEAEFWEYLKPYVLRRLKSEAAPWLPPKQFIPVPVRMTPKQDAQYRQMESEGMALLGSDRYVESTSLLSEYVRLSQFANAYCTEDENGVIIPTRESAKLDALFQKLDEAGIFDDAGTEQTVIFSQYKQMINLVAAELVGKGVPVAVISGDQNRQGARRAIREAFQAGRTKVLCIVTTAGGVSLTLDAADSAHFIDTSWAPDDDEQAEDRIHRVSRIHQVRIYQYVAEDTIDVDKMAVALDKDQAHKYILDVRREILRRKQGVTA